MPINNDDDAYHESGHVVLAQIFDDIFRIEFVTLNLSESQLYDNKSRGGLKGKAAKPIGQFTEYDYDKLILIMLAGLCADDINNNNGLISERLYETSIWSKKFNSIRNEGDIEYAISCYKNIESSLKIRWLNYVVTSMTLLHEIMKDNVVWETINLIRKSLLISQDLTLKYDQIEKIIQNRSFLKWKNKNLQRIIIERKNIFKY